MFVREDVQLWTMLHLTCGVIITRLRRGPQSWHACANEFSLFCVTFVGDNIKRLCTLDTMLEIGHTPLHHLDESSTHVLLPMIAEATWYRLRSSVKMLTIFDMCQHTDGVLHQKHHGRKSFFDARRLAPDMKDTHSFASNILVLREGTRNTFTFVSDDVKTYNEVAYHYVTIKVSSDWDSMWWMQTYPTIKCVEIDHATENELWAVISALKLQTNHQSLCDWPRVWVWTQMVTTE